MDNAKKTSQIDRALEYFKSKGSLNGKHVYTSNLLGHMRNRHIEIYEKCINNSKNVREDLKVKRLKLLQYLTELVTVDRQQFSIFSKPSFQKLMYEQMKPLDIAGIGLNLNDKNLPEIKANIHEIAQQIREKLTAEVKYKLLSMSVDVVTKNNRAVIGIFIQYVHNGLSKVRCIGMKELTQRHTGKYLCTVTEKCLEEYGIKLTQIVSFTSDNGSNMLVLLRNMNEDLAANKIIGESNITLNTQVAENDDTLTITINCDEEISQILNFLDEDGESEIAILFILFSEKNLLFSFL